MIAEVESSTLWKPNSNPWLIAATVALAAFMEVLPAACAAAGGSQFPTPSADTPSIRLENVSPEWNGVAFDPSFEGWKPRSFTDRGDNNSFRFILGNDIAIQAAESGSLYGCYRWSATRLPKGINLQTPEKMPWA